MLPSQQPIFTKELVSYYSSFLLRYIIGICIILGEIDCLFVWIFFFFKPYAVPYLFLIVLQSKTLCSIIVLVLLWYWFRILQTGNFCVCTSAIVGHEDRWKANDIFCFIFMFIKQICTFSFQISTNKQTVNLD